MLSAYCPMRMYSVRGRALGGALHIRSLGRSYISRRDASSHETLPEDTTPRVWQRVAQLIAGTVSAGSFLYFVLLADFGKGDREHCFSPVRVLKI